MVGAHRVARHVPEPVPAVNFSKRSVTREMPRRIFFRPGFPTTGPDANEIHPANFEHG